MAESVRKNLEERYGLNKPVLEQYYLYMNRMFLHGDFGISFKQEHRTVNDIIKNHFGTSALLGIVSLFGALFYGIILGIIAGLKRNKWQDYVAILIAVLGISIPSFVLAYFIQKTLGLDLGILPVGGWARDNAVFSSFENFKFLILPSLALGMIVMASITRLMRSSMLEVNQQDYIKTAKAKGLSRMQIIVKHQVRNAILPVVVYFGPLFAGLLTGTFTIESIFGIPGLGKFFVDSVAQLDYTMIMGLTVFYAGFAIGMILLTDLCYSLVDPRIRLSK